MKLLRYGCGVALAAFTCACGPQAQSAAPPVPAVAPAAADWRQIPAERLLVIDTTKGQIVVEMAPEVEPTAVAQISRLANEGYYDGLAFFRVIDEFMAQTGDKANTGAGESGQPTIPGVFKFRRAANVPFVAVANGRPGTVTGFIGTMPIHSQPNELAAMTADGKVESWGAFCTGVTGMARTGDPNSASAQFFLMRGYTATLDRNYAPWGRVVWGQDVVKAIKIGEPPINPDVMTKVRVASTLPAAERPNLWSLDPNSAAFRSQVAAAVAAKKGTFTACDVTPPVQKR